MRNYILFGLILLFGGCQQVVRGQEDGFKNFLSLALENFPAWVIKNNLDPTPVIHHTINLARKNHIVNLTGEISEQTVYGLSEPGQGWGSGWYRVDASLLDGSFSVGYYLNSVEAKGKYNLLGDILNCSVYGQGASNVIDAKSGLIEVYVSVDGFHVTPSGYINISTASIYKDSGSLWNKIEANLENLDAGPYNNNVYVLIKEEYKKQFKHHNIPFHDYMLRYLEELFAETPVSEIIGTSSKPREVERKNLVVPKDSWPLSGAAQKDIWKYLNNIHKER